MSNGTLYRRGSIFGALLLISIGGLFLYSNLHPDFSPWPLLARYWPLLIIFWGLSKLVNYLLARGTPEEAAASRVTGGDIFGLILLLLFGTFLTRAVESGWWNGRGIVIGGDELACLMGREFEFTDEVTQPVSGAATLTLANLRGPVTLTGGSGDQIRVVARKKVCAASEADAQRLAETIEPVLESTDRGYMFHWKSRADMRAAMGAHLDVQVPAAMSLDLTARRGDVRVSNLGGGVTLNVERGDVFLEHIAGDSQVSLRRGSVRAAEVAGGVTVDGRGDDVEFRNIGGSATLRGEFYGPIRFANIAGATTFESRRTSLRVPRINGELTLDSGQLNLRGVPGDVSVVTRDKEIEMDEVGGRIRVENRDGPVVIRFRTPPTQDIEVENRSAGIELYLPENSGFEIAASARDGEIESDFSGPGLNLQDERRGTQSLSGTYGTRRATIRLSTTYGTIELRRTQPAPAGRSGG